MKRSLLILLISTISMVAFSQETTPGLVTDRPDQTESSVTVPIKNLQIESGFVYESDKAGDNTFENYTFNSTLLRYGVFHNMEFRIGFGYLKEKDKFNSVQGMGPVYLGTKVFINEENGLIPELAILANIVLPSFGKKEFRPDFMGSGIRLAASHTITDNIGFGYNFGAEWDGMHAGATGIYSFVFGFGLTDKLSAFIESYGYLPEFARPDHRMDAGFTYLVTQNFQLDCSGGIGLMEYSPDYFVNFGFSWRIPK